MEKNLQAAIHIVLLGEPIHDPALDPPGVMYQHFMAMCHCRVILPNGRFQDAIGAASTHDPFFTKGGRKRADPADVVLKSQTVAKNRGTANILGGGLSAEEMMGKERPPATIPGTLLQSAPLFPTNSASAPLPR